MMIKLGIDIGSRNTKIVVFDSESHKILFSAYKSTDINALRTLNELLDKAYEILHITLSDRSAIGVTGYGRKLYHQVCSVLTESTCHAAGCQLLFPTVNSIIDIGGQDSKIITLDPHRKVSDFVMNDKCAAGTGRFLEMTALKLGCELPQLSELAKLASKTLKLNSTCVVFAESEIISLMATAHRANDIARAVHCSIAKRISSQMAALSWTSPVVFTGGVALNQDLAKCLSEELACEILIPPDPEITGALGAAILARSI